MHGPPSDPATWRRSSLILLALAAGILTGLGEAAFLELQRLVFGRIVFMGRHAWWMKPIAEGVLFSVLVALFALTGRRLFTLRAVISLCGTLAALSLLMMMGRLHVLAQLVLAIGVGTQLGRFLDRRMAGKEHAVRVAARALVVSVPLVGLAASAFRADRTAGEALAPPDAPNVLLLVLDTVRARSLSAFGHDKPTTPTLEAVAADGVLFERAISTAPWTLPAHASMFTGLPPHEMTADWRRPLDASQPTLAERFRAAGYATAGFVANMGYCGWETGLTRGFGHYEDHPVSWRQLLVESTIARAVVPPLYARITGVDENFVRKSAAEVNRDFLDWVDGERRPFFAFLNYYDAHGPYQPAEPYRSRFAEGEPRGGESPLERWLRDPFQPPPSAAEIERELWAYEAAIAGLDAEIGRLLDDLARRSVLDRTVVVIVSDHGEEFGEHGAYDHGNSLYLDGLHVPLIVRYPERLPSGARVTETVSLRDLPATILDLVELDRGGIPGRSLTTPVVEGTTPPDTPVTSEVSFAPRLPDWFPVSRGDMASLTDVGWHLVRNGDGELELFAIDPETGRTVSAPGSAAAAIRDSLAARLAAEVGGLE